MVHVATVGNRNSRTERPSVQVEPGVALGAFEPFGIRINASRKASNAQAPNP